MNSTQVKYAKSQVCSAFSAARDEFLCNSGLEERNEVEPSSRKQALYVLLVLVLGSYQRKEMAFFD